MKFFIGRKIRMTQLFNDQGRRIAVTAVQGDPCFVVQIKHKEKDGYTAVKVGYSQKKKINKPLLGQNRTAQTIGLSRFQEFRLDDVETYKVGQKITVDSFAVGDKVEVQGFSKGRGFQGVVKRHKFAGSPASHGHKDQLRKSGAIGAGGPQRVFRGKRMAGHMGNAMVKVQNLKVLKVDPAKNTVYLKGAVPGAPSGWLRLSTAK